MSLVEKSTFTFLKQLSENNNREWFAKHRFEYEKAKENSEQFFDALIAKVNTHDQLETPSGRKCLWRIYNDVRFSKDKSPYSPRFAGNLKRVKPMLRGGYYLWLAPGKSRLGCGFSYPNSEDLKRTREDIDSNYVDWNKLLQSKKLRSSFGNMMGDQVRTVPRGYNSDHPAIQLLRYKQYWFERSFKDKEVFDTTFLKTVNQTFKTIRPFFDYMSEVLTTNSNGESVID
jgi:uncharacterized protein (TIGR02453 family)